MTFLAAVDVHKHKNFGVFYNHLLKQRVGENDDENKDDKEEVKIKEEKTTFHKEGRRKDNKAYRVTREDSQSPERSTQKIKVSQF